MKQKLTLLFAITVAFGCTNEGRQKALSNKVNQPEDVHYPLTVEKMDSASNVAPSQLPKEKATHKRKTKPLENIKRKWGD